MKPYAMGVLLVFCACGGEQGQSAVVAMDTVDGAQWWSYAADPGPALDWSIDTLAVVGDAFAEDAYQFNDVTAQRLAGDGDGNLYVLDRQGSRVLKYDPEGRHLATYGREGEGPGELKEPLGLDVGPGDTVWVSDFTNGRITGYPQNGGAPRVLPYGEIGAVPSPNLVKLDDGFIQSFRPLFNFQGGPGGMERVASGDSGAATTPRIPLVRTDPTLETHDTLWSIPEPPTDMVQLEMGDRIMLLMMTREFMPAFQWDVLSDGTVVVADTAAYLLRLLDREGVVSRVIRRDPDPRTTTEADRELARQRLRNQQEGGTRISLGGGGPDNETQRRLLEQRLEKMTFAAVIPRIVSLRVDNDDRIWVGVAEDVPDSIARIDIYEPSGDLVGELRDFPMPDVFLGRDGVGILRRDELDVQQVLLGRFD